VAAKRQGAPVPQALEDFFQKALAREKEDRYQGAQEFMDAMMDAVADLSPEEFDAIPTGSAPEAGSSRPNQRSVSKPGRSSPSGVRARSPSGAVRGGSQPSAARAGSQPSAARAAAPGSRGSQPSSPSTARGASVAASGNRQRTPRPEAPPAPPLPAEPPTAGDSPGGFTGGKIALVAVPLLLIAAGGAFVVLRPSTPVEPSAPVAEVKKEPAAAQKPEASALDSMILVQFRSSPPGATVFDGDVQIGTTPFERRVRRDEAREVSFRLADHQDMKRKLDFNGVTADAQEVSVALVPVKTASAESSRPARPAKPQGASKDPKEESVPIFE
jgi:serine/threonine-protein kinase